MSKESVPSLIDLLKVKKAFSVILKSISITVDAVCITKLKHWSETFKHTCKTCLWYCDCLKILLELIQMLYESGLQVRTAVFHCNLCPGQWTVYAQIPAWPYVVHPSLLPQSGTPVPESEPTGTQIIEISWKNIGNLPVCDPNVGIMFLNSQIQSLHVNEESITELI